MKCSELLRLAKEEYQTSDLRFGICAALSKVTKRRNLRNIAGVQIGYVTIVDRIETLLGGQPYLEGWLYHHHPTHLVTTSRPPNLWKPDYSKGRDSPSYTTRLAWLDWMIADYESQGN